MKKRILVVDDSALIRKVYGTQLEEAGYEVVFAEDGMSAINTTFIEMPDLILLDIHMPKINGYQVCRLLKDHEQTKHIPIIIVTSKGGPGLISDPQTWSFQTGADGYLDKDSADTLVDFVRPFLAQQGPKPISHEKLEPMSETKILLALSALLDKQLYLDVTRLKVLDEKKNAFVANVSHEFRSPLAVLQGNCYLLQNSLLNKITEKQKKTIESSERTIKRLARLVTDLLDLAKIEAGKMALNKEKFNLAALLDETIESYQVLINEKKLRLVKDFPSGENTQVGDRDRLTQVVVNLLNNAIKFTQEEGTISVRLIDEDLQFKIEIEDNGPGMNEEGIKKIFDKFERITSEKREGTGLGLPIARDIVVLHGGKIWAESKEGKGSKFIVVLPKAA